MTPEAVAEVGDYLRTDEQLKMDMLNCITAIDYLLTDPKKAKKADFDPHIEVVYHMSSISLKHSLVMKTKVERWRDGVEGQCPRVASVSQVWRTADWHEREVFDSVRCRVHQSSQTCDESSAQKTGKAIRFGKDYEMPLEYHGMRGK